MSEPSDLIDELIDERRKVYGNPTDTFARMAQMWTAILGDSEEVTAWHVPLMLIAMKIIRTTECPDYSDNSDDIDGYLAIFREIIGNDMVHARSVVEYLQFKAER
jgi:hypothetical protein